MIIHGLWGINIGEFIEKSPRNHRRVEPDRMRAGQLASDETTKAENMFKLIEESEKYPTLRPPLPTLSWPLRLSNLSAHET